MQTTSQQKIFFELDNPLIADINECEIGEARCGPNAYCLNLIDAYDCPCNNGYVRFTESGECAGGYGDDTAEITYSTSLPFFRCSAEISIQRHFRWSAEITYLTSLPWSWTCDSVKVEIKLHVECKLHFPCAQLMLRQMHSTNLSESIDAKYLFIFWLRFDMWIRTMNFVRNRWLKIEVTAWQKKSVSAVSAQCAILCQRNQTVLTA